MRGFADSWLRAREPHDHAVRSTRLAGRFVAGLGLRPRLLDLGSGTGSNIRYLSQYPRRSQDWVALEHDRALRAATGPAFEAFAASSGRRFARTGDALILEGPDGRIRVALRGGDLRLTDRALALEGIDGLSASALLDLTSRSWLDDLAARLADKPVPALFALSFDGRLTFTPERPEDEEIRARFIAHQRTDKGFGPALGPDAVSYLAGALEAHGRPVECEACDWCLDASLRTLTSMFLDGLRPVLDQTPGRRHGPWLERRFADLEDRRLGILVGHQDLLVR